MEILLRKEGGLTTMKLNRVTEGNLFQRIVGWSVYAVYSNRRNNKFAIALASEVTNPPIQHNFKIGSETLHSENFNGCGIKMSREKPLDSDCIRES